uniref:Uncharacterized protein n=1 Tax=Trichuris muris TaxID=70415 RepID=A0A5S6QTW2_TRIMR
MRTLSSLFLVFLLTTATLNQMVPFQPENTRRVNLLVRPYSQRKYFPISYTLDNSIANKRINRKSDDDINGYKPPDWNTKSLKSMTFNDAHHPSGCCTIFKTHYDV